MVICNRKPVNFLQRLPFITRLVGSTSTASVLERLGHATLWSLHEVTWPPLGEKKHHSYSACPGREGGTMDDDAQVCLAVEATRYSIPCSTPACIFVSVASRRRLALAHSRALPGYGSHVEPSPTPIVGRGPVLWLVFFLLHLPSPISLCIGSPRPFRAPRPISSFFTRRSIVRQIA